MSARDGKSAGRHLSVRPVITKPMTFKQRQILGLLMVSTAAETIDRQVHRVARITAWACGMEVVDFLPKKEPPT